MTSLEPLPLESGITSRMVKTITNLEMHVLEAGSKDAPLLLLLHDFRSWRLAGAWSCDLWRTLDTMLLLPTSGAMVEQLAGTHTMMGILTLSRYRTSFVIF